MSDTNKEPKTTEHDEEEIFKSLNHKIRRDIIKLLGDKKTLTFTEIKDAIGDCDSPTISYHLKSLKFIVDQTDGFYFLTDLGMVALLLMDRIDQSSRLKKYKKKFIIANITTILCWMSIMFIIPAVIGELIPLRNRVIIAISLNVFAQINFQIIWALFGSMQKSPRIKKRKMKNSNS